jgi:hypothetical protein
MSLRSAMDDLLAAVTPEAVIVSRSAQTDQYYVLAEDRRQNGFSFERVGIADSLEDAVRTCLDRWNRATPVKVWVDPDG